MSEIKNIEWGRLGIEAAAIIVSILLAFWIDAWWEDRIEKRNHVAQLQSFEQELLENAELLDRQVQDIYGYVSALDEAMQYLGSTEELSTSVYKNIGTGLYFKTDPIASSVYEEILNSGTLQRITSSELKTAIGDYERAIGTVKDQVAENWLGYRDVMVPFLVSHVPFDQLGWQRVYELHLEELGDATATVPEFPQSMKLSDLRSPTAWNTLYYWRVMQTDNVEFMIEARRSIDEVLLHLQAELDSSTTN